MIEMGRMGRGVCTAALLALLAASGYMGAAKEEVRTVSVPIVFETLKEGVLIGNREAWSEETLEKERERTLSLLEDVIRDPRAEHDAVQLALAQKMKIAAEIEREAKISQVLAHQGISGVQAVSGERGMTMLVQNEAALDGKTRVQILDAAVSVTGMTPDCIKIIPAKNE